MAKGTWISIYKGHYSKGHPPPEGVKEKQATTPRILKVRPHNHIFSVTA